MPNTSNYNFEYESPTSIPGTSITGGPQGGSPILAVQVDTALASVETKVDVNATNIGANTSDITALQEDLTDLANWTRSGTVLLNFSNLDSYTAPVVFGFTFPGTPVVTTNINVGAATAARWDSRGISATSTGFTMFVYSNANGVSSSWSDVPVSWIAHYDA